MDDLVKNIEEIRGLHKLSDRQFALSLGVDPSTWSTVKNKLRKPGNKFLSALTRVYPESKMAVLNYMSAGAAK